MITEELDRGHCTVYIDFRAQRPVASRFEKPGHELKALGLAAVFDIVEPQMRAAAWAESPLGKGKGRGAVARDLAHDGDGGGVGLEAQEQPA
jgi:hypothetical protein